MSTLELFKQEGRIEGMEKGRIEARIEIVQKLYKNGFTIKKIVEVLELEEEFVKKAIEKKK